MSTSPLSHKTRHLRRTAREPQQQMDLFQIRSSKCAPPLYWPGSITTLPFAGTGIKQTARMGDKRLVIDITRRREDHSIAAITALHMLHNALTRHRSDRIRSAQDGTPQGLVRKSRQLKVIENAVVRRIVRLANFLDDNGTFAFEPSSSKIECCKMSASRSSASSVFSFKTFA